jgi:hypothetical protein
MSAAVSRMNTFLARIGQVARPVEKPRDTLNFLNIRPTKAAS